MFPKPLAASSFIIYCTSLFPSFQIVPSLIATGFKDKKSGSFRPFSALYVTHVPRPQFTPMLAQQLASPTPQPPTTPRTSHTIAMFWSYTPEVAYPRQKTPSLGLGHHWGVGGLPVMDKILLSPAQENISTTAKLPPITAARSDPRIISSNIFSPKAF